MPCYQSANVPPGFVTAGRPSYTTEADCLKACQEGACCSGTTCTVKPQCQCQGTGQTFKGPGTACSPNPCKAPDCRCTSSATMPVSITVQCRVARPRADRTCPADLNYPLFFAGVDDTFTEVLHLKSQGIRCQGAVYESINAQRWQTTNPPIGPSTDGLDRNGVYLELQNGTPCVVRGYFTYMVFSRNSAGEIKAGEALGTPGSQITGASSGNDQFWDSLVGKEIHTIQFGPACYPTYRGDYTIRIVSVSYLP